MRAILNVLSKEEKNKIDSTSIEILESVGVKIDHIMLKYKGQKDE